MRYSALRAMYSALFPPFAERSDGLILPRPAIEIRAFVVIRCRAVMKFPGFIKLTAILFSYEDYRTEGGLLNFILYLSLNQQSEK